MKENLFLKSVGIEKVVQIINSASKSHNKYDINTGDTVESYNKNSDFVRLDQLKNLIKSINIIEQLGGYEKVKKFLLNTHVTYGKYIYFDSVTSNIVIINTKAYGALHIEHVSEVFNKVESCQ